MHGHAQRLPLSLHLLRPQGGSCLLTPTPSLVLETPALRAGSAVDNTTRRSTDELSAHAGDPVDRGKASITAEQLTAAQQAVQRAIRGLSHDASKPKARGTQPERLFENAVAM